MKILHVITSLRTGGAEKLMVDLIPRLKEKGLDVDLLIFDGTDTPFRQEAEKRGIKILDFGKGNSVYNPKYILKLVPLLKNYDIIHTHNTSPQFFAIIANLFTRKNLITTEHNTTNRRRDKKIFKYLDKWMYSRYKKVICISEKAKENLYFYLKNYSNKFLTIENGIELDNFINAYPSNDLEKIAPKNNKIIMVAGFREQKDQPTLIKALKELPENFHLFLIGDGVRRDEFEALAKSLGLLNRVHFLGIREDIPNLLKSADFVVMSSHFEGLSLSSVEGMASGKPFLASDVQGLSEVVKDAGILFPHQDYKTLAQEILKLDSDPIYYNEVVERCLKRASEFDISKMVDKYNQVYNSI